MNHLVNIDLLLSEERNISSHLSRVFLHTLKNSFLVHLYLKTHLKTELNAQRWGVGGGNPYSPGFNVLLSSTFFIFIPEQQEEMF